VASLQIKHSPPACAWILLGLCVRSRSRILNLSFERFSLTTFGLEGLPRTGMLSHPKPTSCWDICLPSTSFTELPKEGGYTASPTPSQMRATHRHLPSFPTPRLLDPELGIPFLLFPWTWYSAIRLTLRAVRLMCAKSKQEVFSFIAFLDCTFCLPRCHSTYRQ